MANKEEEHEERPGIAANPQEEFVAALADVIDEIDTARLRRSTFDELSGLVGEEDLFAAAFALEKLAEGYGVRRVVAPTSLENENVALKKQVRATIGRINIQNLLEKLGAQGWSVPAGDNTIQHVHHNYSNSSIEVVYTKKHGEQDQTVKRVTVFLSPTQSIQRIVIILPAEGEVTIGKETVRQATISPDKQRVKVSCPIDTDLTSQSEKVYLSEAKITFSDLAKLSKFPQATAE